MYCPKIQKTNYLRKSLTSEHKKVNKKTCWFLAEKIRLPIFAEIKNENHNDNVHRLKNGCEAER